MDVFEHRIRIRYAETDQMGVVYYANFFIYFEEARGEYLRRLGIPYSRLEEEGVFVPIVKAYCEYLKPARYNGLLTVKMQAQKRGNTGIRFEYEIFQDDKVIAQGYTEHAWVNRDMRPIKAPGWLLRSLWREQDV